MSERDVLVEVRLVFGQQPDFVVWRNNSGIAEFNGQKVRYGVAAGGSDLLGIAPGGLLLAVEVKTATGRLSPEQLRFLELVYERGGVACVTRSRVEAELQIGRIRNGERRHF